MAREIKVDYDDEFDILYVYSGEKVKDSLEIDNFVLDFSEDNRVVAVEIFNSSIFVSKLSGLNITKKILSAIRNAKMSIYQSKELFYVVILLPLKMGNVEKEISLQVPAPTAVMAKT